MFRPLFKMPETWRSLRQTHLISQRAYTIPMCVVGVMDSDPLLTGPPEFQRLKKNSLHHQIKKKRRKSKGKFFIGSCYKHGGFFFSSIAPTQYVRAFTARSIFIRFPCFSLLPSFLSRLKWISQYFRVLRVWGCSWKKIQEKEEEEEEESLFRWCVESDGALISPHQGLSPDFGVWLKDEGKKNKRIREKTRTEREVHPHRARARHGGIEDEKEKKTKMDRVFSLFSVTDVPLLCRSAKCLSHYTPILSMFFSSLWNLILF